VAKEIRIDSFNKLIDVIETWIEYHETPTKDQDFRWDQAKCEAWREVVDLIKTGADKS